MTFRLYNAPQSTCSQRVRFVLNAKHLPFDEVRLNLLEGDQLKPEYLKLNISTRYRQMAVLRRKIRSHARACER
jgi:glutathione S-transferase